MENKLTFTVAEAAEAIGVSKPIMYELCNSSDFPSVRVSAKRIVIPVHALNEWINRKADHKNG